MKVMSWFWRILQVQGLNVFRTDDDITEGPLGRGLSTSKNPGGVNKRNPGNGDRGANMLTPWELLGSGLTSALLTTLAGPSTLTVSTVLLCLQVSGSELLLLQF